MKGRANFAKQLALKKCRSISCVACVLVVLLQLELVSCRPHVNDNRLSTALDSTLLVRETRDPMVTKSSRGKPSKSVLPNLRLRKVPPAELASGLMTSKALECEAAGKPPPTIYWLKDGDRIQQSEDTVDEIKDKGVLGLSFTRSRLYLDCIHASDAGRYTCVAENPFSRVSSQTHLNVVPSQASDVETESVALCLAKKSYGSPARIYMWTHTRLEESGSQAHLFCRASGSPSPTIRWTGPNEEPLTSDTKYHIMDTGDLIIKDLIWDDMGEYTCVAANQHATDRISTFVYPMQP